MLWLNESISQISINRIQSELAHFVCTLIGCTSESDVTADFLSIWNTHVIVLHSGLLVVSQRLAGPQGITEKVHYISFQGFQMTLIDANFKRVHLMCIEEEECRSRQQECFFVMRTQDYTMVKIELMLRS